MREIKFRAWSKLDNKMYFESDRYMIADGIIWEFILSEATATPKIGRKFTNVMQYTGFNDKNGKEIYEGDIIQPDINRAVEFKYGKFGYDLTPSTDYNFMGLHQCHDEIEVIGNIYQNPELLNP